MTRVTRLPGGHGLEEVDSHLKKLVECWARELLCDRARTEHTAQELADDVHDDDLQQIEGALITQFEALDAVHKGRE